MPSAHPIDDRLLMGYAAGLLPEAYDLLVATAVSLDDEARVRLAGFEAMGGAVMERTTVAPLREGSFEEVLARINSTGLDDTVPAARRVPRMAAVLPQPLREAVGGDVDSLRWKSVGGGVRQHVVPCWDGDATARLMTIPPGTEIPTHGHEGVELTLVLQGGMRDRDDVYERGDLAVADAEVVHRPVAALGEDCVCLAVTDAPLQFKELLPRIAQRFMDI